MYLNSNHNDVGMVYNIAAAAVITIIGYIIMMLLSVILGESNMYNVIITVLVFIVAFKSTQDLGYRRRVKGPSSRVLNPDLNNSPDSDTESDEGNSSDEEESDREPDQQNVEGFAWVKEREGSVIYSRQYKPVVPVGY